MRAALRIAALICVLSACSFGAVYNVNPSGDCATDIFNIAFVIDLQAVPGDTIQLGPGTFNFTCMPDFGGGPFVHVPALTINGTPGQTVIVGPGLNDETESAAFFVQRGLTGVQFTNLKFTDMMFAIFFGQQTVAGVVSDSQFDRVLSPIHVSRGSDAVRITHNTIHMSLPPTNDLTSALSVGIGVFLGQQNSHVLVADNTITGPGTSLQLRRAQDIFSPDQVIRTAGIWQNDGTVPASTFGRISNNVVSGVDLCIQSTSDFGVVSNNTTHQCGFAIILSNDTDDGVTTAHGNVVTGNDVSGNQVGLLISSATQNVISLNDGRDNPVAGLLFLANPNGANSDNNTFVLNQGSKQGVSGNQGQFVVKLRQ